MRATDYQALTSEKYHLSFQDYPLSCVPSRKCHHHHPSLFPPLADSPSSSQCLSPVYSGTNSESGLREHLTCLFSVLDSDSLAASALYSESRNLLFSLSVGMASKPSSRLASVPRRLGCWGHGSGVQLPWAWPALLRLQGGWGFQVGQVGLRGPTRPPLGMILAVILPMA